VGNKYAVGNRHAADVRIMIPTARQQGGVMPTTWRQRFHYSGGDPVTLKQYEAPIVPSISLSR